eukprot:CFRG3500T1
MKLYAFVGVLLVGVAAGNDHGSVDTRSYHGDHIAHITDHVVSVANDIIEAVSEIFSFVEVSSPSSNNYITCGTKHEESHLRCGNKKTVDLLKPCCRRSSKCGNMEKCNATHCCTKKAQSTAYPSPSPAPNGGSDGYEPVDQVITCEVKEYEGGFKCSGEKNNDVDKVCCRWSKNCGSLRKCSSSYCCTSQAAPSPKPSTSPKPVEDYHLTCGTSHVQCHTGELDNDRKCCRYSEECGSLKKCTTKACCKEPDTNDNQVCECPGAVNNNKCYPSLELALVGSYDGDVIRFGGDLKVKSTIKFTTSVTFSGETCDGARATLIADFNTNTGAMLEATNANTQNIRFENLDITSSNGMNVAAFHSLGSVADAGVQTVKLDLSNVHVYDMTSEYPGVGFFIGSSSGLTVDDDCAFVNLKMVSTTPDMYAGGAAIAVIYLDSIYKIDIAGTFEKNTAFYPTTSLHSGGGAVYLDFIEGDVKFSASFRKNEANQGGAVHVQEVVGKMTVGGLFHMNKAVDQGYGSRAGAFRVLKMHSGSRVDFTGEFIGNHAQGRGGVIATNIHEVDSTMTLNGVFQSNTASTVGGVFSVWSNTTFMGEIIIDGASTIEGNSAIQQNDRSLFDISTLSSMSQDGWVSGCRRASEHTRPLWLQLQFFNTKAVVLEKTKVYDKQAYTAQLKHHNHQTQQRKDDN